MSSDAESMLGTIYKTLPAQRTCFNTLDNWGHKTPTQSKRIKDRKEKIKGSWPGTCIQYTRLHYYYYIRIHKSDAHTISHVLIFKKTKRYNACTICHHLVGDKTCRGNKKCRNVPHYSQYIQNFLTGRVRFCTWFLKVSLVSKIRQKNLASFTTLIGVFPKGCSGPGEIHTAGESGCIASLKRRT